jgi:hypothetical protein
MILSNTQATIPLYPVYWHGTQIMHMQYNEWRQKFIFDSISEDTYQLSLILLPDALKFKTEVQYNSSYQIQHECECNSNLPLDPTIPDV